MVFLLENMLPLLCCPRTGGSLHVQDGELRSDAGEAYPIVNGKPILVRQVQDFHVTPPPPAFISKNTATYEPPHHLPSAAICLHLGSGNVPSDDPRVISMDILPTESTDIVAEAEALPFKTGSLDYVASGAVFEHVFSPIESAKEVRRVLKDGGEMFIDTAFLQGYHGFPSHYFNMTPQAVETFICDDFVLEDSYVPDAAMATHALATQLERFLELVDTDTKDHLETMDVRTFIKAVGPVNSRSHHLPKQISEYGHRSLAASFAVSARKPYDYEARRRSSDSTASDRAAYYALRLAILQRHHEIELYRRLTLAKSKPTTTFSIPSARDILLAAKVTDPLAPGAYRAASETLREWDANLTRLRDETIALYLA